MGEGSGPHSEWTIAVSTTVRNALVTGATGFIGGRLLERLVLEQGAHVRTLVRNFTHASRVARFPVEMIEGSLTDPAVVDRAVAGCEVVFHCAYDFANQGNNQSAALLLGEACLRHRIACLVHLSSFSVYEPLSNGDVDELSPWPATDMAYALAKRRVEEVLLELHRERGLAVVILEPTVVYGPFCEPWTLEPVRLMRTGRVVLPGDGDGLCNAVYVDDVVSAMLLAAGSEVGAGERLLVSGDAAVTWRDFYGAFARMLGVDGVVCLPEAEIHRLIGCRNGAPDLRQLRRDPRTVTAWRPARMAADLVRNAIGTRRWERLKTLTPAPLHIPSASRLDFLGAQARVRIDKARRVLRYQPAFPFERGMGLTAQFVRWANL